ncbi:two-component system NtrC family sensor kinase [Pedobacter sp. CG_S7]|uniref:sensor histidine kinase n=1 Tax=Pedobacter sp. CG_S7 TaxID=3143930 RepID=UPI003396A127
MKFIKHFVFITLLFSAIFSKLEIKAQVKINISNKGQQNISNQVYIFEDASGKLSLTEVIAKNKFNANREKVANVGLTSSKVWIKLQLLRPIKKDDIYLEIKNPTFDQVTLYTPIEKGFTSRKSGQSTSIKKRDLEHQNVIFKLAPFEKDTITYYLSIKSVNPINLPIYLGDFKSTVQSIELGNVVFSLYLGLILTMFVYNIFIYITVRDRSYFFYVIYIISVGFTQASLQGYSLLFFWGDNIWLNNQGIVFSIVFVGITSILFTKEFLHVNHFLKKFTPILNGVIICYAIGFFVSLVGYPIQAQIILQALTLAASLLVVITGILIYRKNYRPALYFIISWSCFLLGVFIFILKDVGILPPTFLINNAILIGSGLEAVLLSFALADKINIFKKEKEESQAEALRISTENEKLVREQNVLLEIKVKERTEALETVNDSLNNALFELKEAQSQLVDAEKMAGLGQLTAGIAHEINNPINFVTSNIKPLELDINELNEVIMMYESLDINGDIEKQINTINAFKRRIDINFVRTEIKSLLSGIGDGARRTAEIIRSLKNFSRLDESDTKPVDLNEGLDSTLVLIRSTFPHQLKVIKEYVNASPVECMPGKINQVFMNLINNAVQAIKSKPVIAAEEYLWVKTWQEDNQVKISIKDSGSGMSDEVKQKIFEPFFTTKDVGEGTGLGLSIVFRIIENHQGTIEVLSKKNQGTEFIITLPLHTK